MCLERDIPENGRTGRRKSAHRFEQGVGGLSNRPFPSDEIRERAQKRDRQPSEPDEEEPFAVTQVRIGVEVLECRPDQNGYENRRHERDDALTIEHRDRNREHQRYRDIFENGPNQTQRRSVIDVYIHLYRKRLEYRLIRGMYGNHGRSYRTAGNDRQACLRSLCLERTFIVTTLRRTTIRHSSLASSELSPLIGGTKRLEALNRTVEDPKARPDHPYDDDGSNDDEFLSDKQLTS